MQVRTDANSTNGIFYGWVVVLASAVLLALGLGMLNSTNSVFVKPVCDELGFSRGDVTLHRTIITLISALAMPFYGRLIQRAGVRRVMLACALMLGLVAAGYSFATKLWHFYLIAAFHGIFYNGVSFMSVGILVNDWFDGRKGLALGLAYSGSGLGGAVMVPVVSRIIARAGWQWAYRFMGLIAICVMIPVVLAFVRNHPGEMNLAPLPADEPRPGGPREAEGLTLREAMGTGRFWALIAAFALIGAFANATNTHSASYLSDLGYPAAYVSAVISLFMASLTVGKIVLGQVYDRSGAAAGNGLVSLFCLGYPVFALMAAHAAMAWVYAVFVGFASCSLSVSVAILIGRYFGRRDFPAIFSLATMIPALASSAAVPAMGAVYDFTGSYRPAWYALLIASAIITLCLAGVERAHKRVGRALRANA